jgi:putative peptidoglycan lipid II flippase
MLSITANTLYKRWIGRTFSFRLSTFRINRSLYVRRFSVTEAATLLLLAYLASKVLGLVRQILFNSLFGAGSAATAYYVAFSVPDTIFNLIAGGALVHALVPVFLSYEKDHGKAEVWRFISLVFNILLVTLTVIILVAEIVTPQFVSNILAPGLTPKEQALTTTLTRIMLLQPLILGIGTIATAALHSKRQFVPSAISIAIYDGGLIIGVLCAHVIPGVGIYGPTFGLLLSALCQVAVLIPGLLKLGARYTFTWNLRNPGLLQLLRLLGPNVLTIGVTSVGSIVMTSFATYLPDKASIAAMHNANLLFGLPLTLFGLTLANALLPQITIYATHGRYVRMSWTVWRVVGGAVLLSIPVAILLYVLGKPAIQILFQHGAFNAHASALTHTALLGFAIGLPGQTLGLLTVLGFYALKDALTPLIVTVFELAAHVGFAVFLLKIFNGGNAILALPMSASLSATLAATALCLILFLRLRAKVKTDRGMQRLLRRRSQVGTARYIPQMSIPFAVPDRAPVAAGDPYWHDRTGQRSGYQFARIPNITRPLYSSGAVDRSQGDHNGALSPYAKEYADGGQGDRKGAPLPYTGGPISPRLGVGPMEAQAVIASDGYGAIISQVRRHIALIHDPATDPVVILEMLTSICRQLRGMPEGYYDTVVDEYKQAAAMHPQATFFQFVLGQFYQQRGSFDKAVDAYMLAMQNNLFEVIARFHAAQCLIQEGLPGVAILQLQQALQSTYSTAASPIHGRIWVARPREEGEALAAPEAEISQLLARASESKNRQEQMHTFLRRVKQTPSSYHGVVPDPRQFAFHQDYGSGLLQEITQLEPYDGQTNDELADIYKIRGILHETIAKLCEQAVIYLRNNQLEQAGAALQRIGALYEQLGDTQEAHTHMRRAEELASNKPLHQQSGIEKSIRVG